MWLGLSWTLKTTMIPAVTLFFYNVEQHPKERNRSFKVGD